PGVRLPVAVVVAEVVRLPRESRQDDGDAVLTEAPWSKNERRIANPMARARELGEVQTAWRVGNRNADRLGLSHGAQMHGARDGRSVHLVTRLHVLMFRAR